MQTDGQTHTWRSQVSLFAILRTRLKIGENSVPELLCSPKFHPGCSGSICGSPWWETGGYLPSCRSAVFLSDVTKIILVSMRYFKAFHKYAAYSSVCPSTCNNSDPNEWNLMQLRAVRGPYSILQIKFCIGPNLIIWYFGLCESLIGTRARADWWNHKIFQIKP